MQINKKNRACGARFEKRINFIDDWTSLINQVYEVHDRFMKLQRVINQVYEFVNQVYEVSEIINLVYEATYGDKPGL